MSEEKTREKPKKKIIKFPKVNEAMLPKWLHPIRTDEGDIKDFQTIAADLADTVIDRLQIQAFTGPEKSVLARWDDIDKVWKWLNTDDVQAEINNEMELGFEQCGIRLPGKITTPFIANTYGQVVQRAPRVAMADSFDRLETPESLNVIPCQSFDWLVDAPDGQHVNPFPDPENYFTHRLPYDIDPEDGYQVGKIETSTKAWMTNGWLLESVGNDLDQLNVLKILIGSCLRRSYADCQYVVMMFGNGEDGKSTFLSYLQDDLLGSTNTSAMSLEQLIGQPGGANYNAAELYHKWANICSDIKGTKLDAAKMAGIKTLTGADWINAQRKFQTSLHFKSYAKLWFSCNQLPRISNLTYGEERRFMIFRWHRIPDFRRRFDMAQMRQERGAFMFECLEEFQAYLQRLNNPEISQGKQANALPVPPSMKQNFTDFKALGDPVIAFINSACRASKGQAVSKSDLFEAFKNWCNEFGHKKAEGISQTAFSRRVGDMGLPTKKFKTAGKTWRGFAGLELLPEDDWTDYDDVMESREAGDSEEVVDLDNDQAEETADMSAFKPSPVLDPSPVKRMQYVKLATDDELDDLVKDPSEKVREEVARRGRPQDLDQLVKDPNEDVRRVAKQALEFRGGQH